MGFIALLLFAIMFGGAIVIYILLLHKKLDKGYDDAYGGL